MNRIKYILLALTLVVSATGFAAYQQLEQAYEAHTIRVSFKRNNENEEDEKRFGTVSLRECAACKVIKLELAEDTKLFVDDKPIPIQELARYNGRSGVVFYATDTTDITRIMIYK